MGTFYGSIHARQVPVRQAMPVVRALAKTRDVSFYLHPTTDWLSIFPSERGQDIAISALIAERLDTHVVHVLLHDSDVFAYTVYRSSQKIDEYASHPDYFGPATAGDHDRLRGHPARFAELIQPTSSVAKVEEVLEAARQASTARSDWLRHGKRLHEIHEAASRQADDLVLVSRPKKARTDEELVGKARQQLGIHEDDVNALVMRLSQDRNPTARRLLEDYSEQIAELLRTGTSADGGLRRMNPLTSLEESFRKFAYALDLPEADLTYEDLTAVPGLLHVVPGDA
jgi:hypothetical protein